MKRLRAFLPPLFALCLSACPDGERQAESHDETPKHLAKLAKPRPPTDARAGLEESPPSKPEVTSPSTSNAAPPALPPDRGPPLPALPSLSELTFSIVDTTLWVSSPLGSASLTERAHKVQTFNAAADAVLVQWKDEYSCTPDESRRFTRAFLQARLENTRAYRLYKRDQFAEAARGFRRATELDPDYALARTNWIAALARAGDLPTARAAYLHALNKDAVHTYEKLLTDEDVEPLRAEFKKKLSRVPSGPFQLNKGQLAPYAGYSTTHRLIAVLRIEHSWGAENWTAVLHVFDSTSHTLLGEHTLVDWKDMSEAGLPVPSRRKALEERLQRFNEILAALDVAALRPERQSAFQQIAPERSVREAKLTGFTQSLVADKGTLRLVTSDKVSDTFSSALPGADPAFAYPIPEMNALVYFGRFTVSEGCDSGPEARLEVFPTTALVRK